MTKNIQDMPVDDFQKLLQLGVQSLGIQMTLLENQMTSLNTEARTLERDDEMEQVDRQLIRLRQDRDYYKNFIDPAAKINLERIYYAD